MTTCVTLDGMLNQNPFPFTPEGYLTDMKKHLT